MSPPGSSSAPPPSFAFRLFLWLPSLALSLLLALRLCHEWFGPDIWYHLYLGERVAQTHLAQPPDHLILQQPGFVNVYWLFQLIVAGVYALGGLVAVSGLFVVVWFAAFWFWLQTCSQSSDRPSSQPCGQSCGAGFTPAIRPVRTLHSPFWSPWLALAALLVCQTRFEERPEVFSYLFLAIEIAWLARWPLDTGARPAALAGFALVQVAWSNVHGYFVLGPLLVAAKLVAVALGTPRDEWPRLRSGLRSLALLLVLTLLASVASPFGLRNWTGVAALWEFFGEMRHEVQEFLPPTGSYLAIWSVKLFWLMWGATAIAAGFLAIRALRSHLFALILAAAGLYLSATSFRNIPLLVFFAAPLAGAVLVTTAPAAAFTRARQWSTALFTIATLALAGVAISASNFGVRESPEASPVAFASYLRSTRFAGRLFDPPGDGGYLEQHFPALTLYGDSRYVEAAPVRRYFAASRTPEAFRSLDAEAHFDAALFKVSDSRVLIRTLLRDPQWHLVYADLYRALLVKTAILPPCPENLAPYRGEDLTRHANAEAALQWVALYAEANDAPALLRTLQAFGAAPQLPPVILEVALRYALATRNREVFTLAQQLRPKMHVTTPADAAIIDRLLAQNQFH